MVITRGTTPENTFTLPFTPQEGTEYCIVYAQGEEYEEKFLFEKTTKHCTVEGNTITVRLDAKDTLLFDCKPRWNHGRRAPLPIWIQIGLETPSGEKLWSDPIKTTPGRCLKKDGVI